MVRTPNIYVVHKEAYLEVNTRMNREPVKLLQRWRDVVVWLKIFNETRCCMEDSLDRGHWL